MKPQLLKVTQDLVHSFSARRDTKPNVNNRWHYHPEVELIYFKNGSGTQFIGDNISPFAAGDVMLVGSDLPHYWKFDEIFFGADPKFHADVSVVHFNENFWGANFLQLPENKSLKLILERAKRGIKVIGEERESIGLLIEKIVDAEGTRKIIALIEVLVMLGECQESKELVSIGFHHNFLESEKDRIHNIYNYTISNFKNKITLEDISAIANISPNSFCKFFKSRSRKTYSQFLNEIRIGYACKLLIENQLTVKEISYESGFNNFASFHKFFRQVTRESPLGYRKKFLKG
jgi:AraC-like DNA-binding protein